MTITLDDTAMIATATADTHAAAQAYLHLQASLPALAVRSITPEHIRALESAIDQSGQGVELPVRHIFTPGVYARELHVPKGAVLTGRTHRLANLNILTQGDMSVLVDGRIQRISAPATIVSPAGTKRVAYCHTACVWTTIHGTHSTDLAEIEAEFLEPEPVNALAMDQHAAQAMLAAIIGGVH